MPPKISIISKLWTEKSCARDDKMEKEILGYSLGSRYLFHLFHLRIFQAAVLSAKELRPNLLCNLKKFDYQSKTMTLKKVSFPTHNCRNSNPK